MGPIGVVLVIVLLFGVLFFVWKNSQRPTDSDRSDHALPGGLSDEQIARGIEASWDRTAGDHYRLLRPYLKSEEAEALTRTKIEVDSIQRLDRGKVTAVVRPSVEGGEVPDVARALLLGTRQDLAHGVEQARRQMEDDSFPLDMLRVFCEFEDGQWQFIALEDERAEAEADAIVAIGEPVALQTDWKEPPFAVTVLGPPEIEDATTLRVPVRITGIVPRWSYDDVGGFIAFLRTAPDENGELAKWNTSARDEYTTLPPVREAAFKGLTLALGGTHEDFIYFKADDPRGNNEIPDRPFTELHYMDGTETVIFVDLSRSVPVARRPVFENGALQRTGPTPDLTERLRRHGSDLWDEAEPPTTGIGDTVSVTHNPGTEWLDLTVLGPPEASGTTTVRLPVRLTARVTGREPYHRDLPLQLSTGPDAHGRLHHLWEAWSEAAATYPDSLDSITLSRGESREGFVYFRPDNDATGLPDEPFTLLWYGPRLLELPIMLASNE